VKYITLAFSRQRA